VPEPDAPDGPDDFCRQLVDLIQWNAANATGEIPWAEEVAHRFLAMRAAAPASLKDDVDVAATLYIAVAEDQSGAVLGHLAEPFPAAMQAMADHCGVDPSSLGGG
jgi:hypothetical protein